MNKIKKSNQYTDYSVNDAGVGIISQRECARLMGIPQTTFNRHVLKKWVSSEIYTLGLTEHQVLEMGSVFAQRLNTSAVEFLCKIGQAGLKVYIYGMAGVKLSESTEEIIHLKSKLGLAYDYIDNLTALDETVNDDIKIQAEKKEELLDYLKYIEDELKALRALPVNKSNKSRIRHSNAARIGTMKEIAQITIEQEVRKNLSNHGKSLRAKDAPYLEEISANRLRSIGVN